MPSRTGAARDTSLAELARLFLKLGVIGFGGPAAHVALIEDEVVQRRQWLTRDAFLDYVGATNIIPGPNSTELAIQIGRDRAGWPGLLIAGACFIFPAAVMVTLLAWGYSRFGQLPNVAAALSGVKAVVIAIVLQALWRLTRTAIRTTWLALVALASGVAAAAGLHELVVLFGAAVVTGAASAALRSAATPSVGFVPMTGTQEIAAAATALGSASAPVAVSLLPMFGIFLKIGSLVFGSGYVLLAFLRADLVERLGWLTEQQLLDAVAVGQITPGPVFTAATFIGYLLSGVPGAAVATLGIFLPAFVFVTVSGPLVRRIRESRIAGAALDGVIVASLALMAVVTWQLGRATIVDVFTATVAVVAAGLLFTGRVSPAWLVAGGVVAGYIASLIGSRIP